MIQHAVAKKTGFFSWVALNRKGPHVQVNPPKKKISIERSDNPHAENVKKKIDGCSLLMEDQVLIVASAKRSTLNKDTLF